MRRLIAALIASGAICIVATAGNAAEEYTITRCPPDKPYCVKLVKPALSPAEVAELEGNASTSVVTVSPAAEVRKAKIRAEAGYHDPGALPLGCIPPRRMTERDGCQ